MKRLIEIILLTVLCAGKLCAERSVYDGKLVNEAGLAYSNTYVLDLGASEIDRLTMQPVFTSATFSAATILDGTPPTGYFTVVSTAGLNPAYASDTLTVGTYTNLKEASATNTLTVPANSTTALTGMFVNLNGWKLWQGNEWDIGLTSTATAANIATAIDNSPNFTATATNGTITITIDKKGTAGNAYTLSSSTPTALVPGAALFTGGKDNASFAINGINYFAGDDWTVGANNNATSSNIYTFVNTYVPNVSASSSSAVVTITANDIGAGGNSYTLTSSSPAYLTAGSANFTGGVTAAYVTIGAKTLTAGTNWTAVATATGTAKAISNAIVADSTLSPIVVSTWTSTIVYATSTYAGTDSKANQYYLNAWPAAKITPSGAKMNSSVASAFNLSNSQITSAAHGFTLGLPLLLTTTAGTLPSTLSAGTTYYTIPIDTNHFQLATTSARALAGTNVTISTQTQVGGGTFVLTPLAFDGTWSWKWTGSNDGTNYDDTPFSAYTYTSPSSAMYDFGDVNYRYLRLEVTAGTGGAMNLVVTGHGKGGH